MTTGRRASLLTLAPLVACVAKEPEDTMASTSTNAEAPTAECVWDEPADECRAKPMTCEFLDGVERASASGECIVVPGEVGWCETLPTGGSDALSSWYEVATGRVFSFSEMPFSPPVGREICTCDPPSPEACACDGSCASAGTTSSSGGQ